MTSGAAGRSVGESLSKWEGARRGVGVASLLLLFVVSPLLMVWTQLPAIYPPTGLADPTHLLPQVLGDAGLRAARTFAPVSLGMLALGALFGAAKAPGPLGIVRPRPLAVVSSLLALPLGLLHALTARDAFGRVERSLAEAIEAGRSSALGLGYHVPLNLICLALFGAVLAGIAVLGLRPLTPARGLALLVPAAVVAVALADGLVLYGGLVAAGALGAALLPLPPEQVPNPRRVCLLDAASWSVGAGLTIATSIGMAVGLGSVSRLSALKKGIADSGPELIPQLLGAGLALGALGLVLNPIWIGGAVRWLAGFKQARRTHKRLGVLLRPGAREVNVKLRSVPGPWVLAMVFAGFWATAVTAMVAHARGVAQVRDVMHEEVDRELSLVDVVIATRDLEVGEPLRAGDVAVRGMPTMALPAGVVLTTEASALGRIPTERILANEVVRTERLGVPR